jgi:cobalt-zinc-cadmium resistance protein CzcA
MPALSATLLPRRLSEKENFVVAGAKRLYRPALRKAMSRPTLVVTSAALVVAGAGFLATRLGSEFVPRLREGAIVINTIRLAGVSVEESVRYGLRIERAWRRRFRRNRAHLDPHGNGGGRHRSDGSELSDIFITLKDRSRWRRAKTQDELVSAMQEKLSGFPGMRMVFTQPIEMRVNEMIAGVRADVGVKLFGDDFDVLKASAREIETVMKGIPGAADVFVEQLTGQPVLEIEVDRDAIARHGIPSHEVLEAVAALGTREVGVLQEGERRFPIAISLENRYRTDPGGVGRILVTAANGDQVRWNG